MSAELLQRLAPATSDADTGRSIRTPDQRLRVFISSSLEELAPERAAARAAVQRLRLTPVLFELGARPHPPRALYRAYLDQSDVFVGIYWQRYGWVAPDLDVSGLEDEYLLWGAKPRLVYVKLPAPEREPQLSELLQRIEDGGSTSYRLFETAAELGELLSDDLALLLSEGFGWARDGHGAPSAASPAPQRLPVPLTRLIGREREVEELCLLLADERTRLLTVTGAGGTGKSRLAIEAGRRSGPRFPGGAVFVDLAPATGDDLFLPELARALAVAPDGARPLVEAVAERLSRQPALLVVDNFEHVIGAAPVLASILSRCPEAQALVTSRVPLRVRGEREYRASPLATPAAHEGLRAIGASAAAQLFVERAADAAPGFGLTEANADAVGELCRRLDGLPLALELAAARVRILSPAALLDRLGGTLDLPAGQQDVPERQRTLRATLDWSYELLDEPEQAVFARLAIFNGGWTLAAAEAVCGGEGEPEVLDTLSTLVEKSLVAADAPLTVEPRFRMLETIREYAAERLAALPGRELLARRHAEYYVGLCEQAGPNLHGPEQRLWFARLDADVGNVRALVDWALAAGEHELIVRAWASAMLYWWMRDLHHWVEMRLVLERVVPLPETVPAKTRGEAAWLLGTVRLVAGDLDGARPLFQDALALARLAEDRAGTALSLAMLGAVAPQTGGPEGAWALHREALAIARELEWRWGIAYVLHHLGDTAIRDRNGAAAIAYDTECLQLSRDLENEPMAAMALWQLGWGHLLEGDGAQAQEALAKSAAVCLRLGSIENLSYCLDGFAAVALGSGDARLSARLSGAADAARALLRIATFPPLAAAIHEFRRPVREALGEAGFAAEHEAGAALTAEDAVAVALAAR